MHRCQSSVCHPPLETRGVQWRTAFHVAVAVLDVLATKHRQWHVQRDSKHGSIDVEEEHLFSFACIPFPNEAFVPTPRGCFEPAIACGWCDDPSARPIEENRSCRCCSPWWCQDLPHEPWPSFVPWWGLQRLCIRRHDVNHRSCPRPKRQHKESNCWQYSSPNRRKGYAKELGTAHFPWHSQVALKRFYRLGIDPRLHAWWRVHCVPRPHRFVSAHRWESHQ